MIEVRRPGRVLAGRHRPQGLHVEPGPLGQQPKLAWREAGRPQVEFPLLTRLVANRGPFVVDTGGRVEGVAVFQVANDEVRRERAHRHPPPRAHGAGELGEHHAVLVPAEQPEAALAQGHHGIERPRRHRQRTGISPHRCAAPHQPEEVDADVDADHVDAERGEAPHVASRPAADVEHPHPRLEAEHVPEKRELLLGPLGERVPQIGAPRVRSDRLEEPLPIAQSAPSGPGSHSAGSPKTGSPKAGSAAAEAVPLASAQVAAHERLTASGTRSSAAPSMAASTISTAASSSSGGTSRRTSSWTWSTSRLANPSASRRASRRTRATLKMSAASPWMPAFMAWRSPA